MPSDIDTQNWLTHIYEALIEAAACLDSLDTVPVMDKERIEAIHADVYRACNEMEKILTKHNWLPEWATRQEDISF